MLTIQCDFFMKVITIGRNPRNKVVLSDKCVSWNHCQIIDRGGQYYIVDLESTNGTYINGQRIYGEQKLAFQDRVNVADIPLKWQSYVGNEKGKRGSRRLWVWGTLSFIVSICGLIYLIVSVHGKQDAKERLIIQDTGMHVKERNYQPETASHGLLKSRKGNKEKELGGETVRSREKPDKQKIRLDLVGKELVDSDKPRYHGSVKIKSLDHIENLLIEGEERSLSDKILYHAKMRVFDGVNRYDALVDIIYVRNVDGFWVIDFVNSKKLTLVPTNLYTECISVFDNFPYQWFSNQCDVSLIVDGRCNSCGIWYDFQVSVPAQGQSRIPYASEGDEVEIFSVERP